MTFPVEEVDLPTALKAIRGVRAQMNGLRWWLCTTEIGKELDNQIWRALRDVPEDND